ncbi:MAG TPA: chorismate mutase [Candidatus Limnocylindrales bacterium]|nr:chorismate mutase [Candidatus Limnocylindrales bacterium]
MAVRGIRGATTVEEDSSEAILDATCELLNALVRANEIATEDVAAAWFTTTRDLTAEFPALAARRMGWREVPMLCGHEMDAPTGNPRSLARCIRVLVLVNTERAASELRFVYLRGARDLRSEP